MRSLLATYASIQASLNTRSFNVTLICNSQTIARQHGLRLSNVANTNVSTVNTINGAAINSVASGIVMATIAGGGAVPAPGSASVNSPNQVTGDAGTVGGGFGNIAADIATIGGGQQNQTSGAYAVIGGGYQNQAGGNATVAGGAVNLATGQGSFVGGGTQNTASGQTSTVAGGRTNSASGIQSFVGGGSSNSASGGQSVAVGGVANFATGGNSVALGGVANLAQASSSLAAGYSSRALNDGSFVWADFQSYAFPSTANNQFNVRATGGVRFVTANDGAGAPTRTVSINNNGTLDFGSVTRQNINLWGNGIYGIGVQAGTQYFCADGNSPIGSTSGFSWHLGGVHSDVANSPGAGGFELMRLASNGDLKVLGGITGGVILNASDRNLKSLIQTINPQAILAKVAAMPISRWVYSADEKKSWHLDPMAQDFRAAFGLGEARIVALEKKLAAIEKRLER